VVGCRAGVPNTPGQQFLGNIALDVSTGTVNIRYYSSQNDPFEIAHADFLAQVRQDRPPSAPLTRSPALFTTAPPDSASLTATPLLL